MNRTGFQNLVQLSTVAFLEGFYYKPRIDKELLEAHSEGIICLSGCAAGELSNLLLGDRMDEAEQSGRLVSRRLRRSVLSRNSERRARDPAAVCRGDDRSRQADGRAAGRHERRALSQPGRRRRARRALVRQHGGPSRATPSGCGWKGISSSSARRKRCTQAFPDHADAVAITQEIANRVDIDLDLSTRHFPVFTPPAGEDRRPIPARVVRGAARRCATTKSRPRTANGSITRWA